MNNPVNSDLRMQSIRRLEGLATGFANKRLFALEDLCQKIIDIMRDPFLQKCNTCGYKDYIEWHFQTANECKECYRERNWDGYVSYRRSYKHD